MDDFDIVIRTIRLLVIERLDRHAVLVFEERIEQRAVRVAARMAHDVDLERCGVDERKQLAIVVRLQITDGFDILQIIVIVQLGDLLVVIVQLVTITEDDGVLVVS